MELAIALAANVALGLVLLALFKWRRPRDTARLAGPTQALIIFQQQVPDAAGTATVAADGLTALVALDKDNGSGVGLLHRHGRRWNARELLAEDIGSVTLTHGDAITLSLADFGWPRMRVRIEDPQTRAAWLARLSALAAQRSAQHSMVTHHA
jgi:hypothetical protein